MYCGSGTNVTLTRARRASGHMTDAAVCTQLYSSNDNTENECKHRV